MGINVDNKNNSIIEDLKDNVSMKSINQSNEKQHLQIARGNKANLPTLLDGELALVKDEGKVYVGNNNENIALAKDSEVQGASHNLNQLKTNYFGKEFETPQERLLDDFKYLHMSGERGDFLPFSASKSHKIQESIEGKTRDMILEGEISQNLALSTLTNTTKDADSFYTSTVATYDYLTREIPKIKPSTTYTIVVDMVRNSLSLPFRFSRTNFWATSLELFKACETGVKSFLIVSKDNFEGNEPYGVWFGCGNPNTTTGEFMFRYMLLEGDWTNKPIPSYHEGIYSPGQENNRISILSTGKNLYNPKINDFVFDKNNYTTPNVNGYLTCICPLKLNPNKNYIMTIDKDNTKDIKGYMYISNDIGVIEFIHRQDISITNLSFNIKPNKDGYIVFRATISNSLFDINAIKSSIRYIQIEEETQTTYEPYKENKKDILLPFDGGLKSINNIKDEINSMGRKITQRIGVYEITGNEDWRLWSKYGNEWTDDREVVSFAFKLITAPDDRNIDVICNNFVNGGVNIADDGNHPFYTKIKEYVSIYYANTSTNQYLAISVLKSKIGVNRDNWKDVISLFKKFIKNNKTIIYYELAKPIEHDLTQDINLATHKDLTYVESETSCSFKAPVTISNTIARLNSENKTLEQENNQLQENSKTLASAMLSLLEPMMLPDGDEDIDSGNIELLEKLNKIVQH